MPSGSKDPFGRHARDYFRVWEQDPSAQAQRRAVQAVAAACFPERGRILDLGCGTGIDAAWLQSTGRVVVARDASAGMVAATRARGVEAEVLRAEDLGAWTVAPFDGALLDFGVVNCIGDLPALSTALRTKLLPGAPLVVVSMPRVAPMWLLGAVRHGRWGAARARLRERTTVEVDGEAVPVTYLGRRQIAAGFGREFRIEQQLGLGFLLPAPGSRWGAGWLEALRLEEAERPFRGVPGLRELGDHVLFVLRACP